MFVYKKIVNFVVDTILFYVFKVEYRKRMLTERKGENRGNKSRKRKITNHSQDNLFA